MNIDKQSAIKAAAITVAIVGIVAILCWSIESGPDWIWQTILIAACVAVVFYASYELIRIR